VCQILFLLNYDKRIIKIYKSINRRGISSNNLLKLVEITQLDRRGKTKLAVGKSLGASETKGEGLGTKIRRFG
jgi:hypothetical protein